MEYLLKKRVKYTCYNMDELKKYYAKWKMPNTKDYYILYYSILFLFMKFPDKSKPIELEK